ncbi:hypothetical protein D6855_14325 [Butyrivibrio sp. CB08]|nr:hypothetical protein D6855_14325 [Butyrivibrio sp. CB08]
MPGSISEYKCLCADRIKKVGIIVQIINSIVGVILLFALFDDWNMMWLYAIVSCVALCVSGYVTRILCDCLSVITENQYLDYMNRNIHSDVAKKDASEQLPEL